MKTIPGTKPKKVFFYFLLGRVSEFNKELQLIIKILL